jgi:glucosamine--fructose-6-phosphate aminotransferase (isomerizing)
MTALAETIPAQPQLLAELLGTDLGDAPRRLREAARIWLVGTGTSQHAAELGTLMFAEQGIDARPISSAGFARFGPELDREDAVIVITHSGETAHAQAARERVLAAGAALVAITGRDAGWEHSIETVPKERSHTYTASYTATLLILARLAGLDPDGLAGVPERARAAVADPGLREVPPTVRLLALIGPGPYAVTAREGALKLREAAHVLAEGYEAEYFLHGHAVPFEPGDGLVLLQPDADPDGLVAGIGEAAAAVGVVVWPLAEPPGLHPLLAQIPLTVRVQSLASRLADERETDPDKAIVGPWWNDELWRRGAPA